MDKLIYDWVHSLNVNSKDREKIALFTVYSMYNSYDDDDLNSLQNMLIYGDSQNSSENMNFATDKKNEILNIRSRSESPDRINDYVNYKIDYIYVAYILLAILFLCLK